MTIHDDDVIAEDLERLIDTYGLSRILTAIETICYEKAAHLRSNWQDDITARTWDYAAKACYKAACNSSVNAVS